MVRFREEGSALMDDIVGLARSGRSYDFYEVQGDDVYCWVHETELVEVVAYVDRRLRIDEDVEQALRKSEERKHDAEVEVMELQRRLRRTYFRPIYEWRLCQQINELKQLIVDECYNIERMKEELSYWVEIPNMKTVERHSYHCEQVWHVNCNITPIFEGALRPSHSEKPTFEQINFSIIMALANQRMDKRKQDVDEFSEDCKRNHGAKFKVFLDTSREGYQLKMIGCTFEDLLKV